MAILKNTIVNGNLKVNSDITATGSGKFNGLDIRNKIFYVPSSGSSIDIDGDLNVMGLINCDNIVLGYLGAPAYPRVTVIYSMIESDDPLTISTLIGAASMNNTDYCGRLWDTILVSLYAPQYGSIIDRDQCTISNTPYSTTTELQFPIATNLNDVATVTSKNKIYHNKGGVLSLEIKAKTDVDIVVEYSKGLTTVN